MQTKAIIIDQPGGPEVMQWRDVEVAEPTGRELRLKQTAVGLNYIDTYHRSGLYPMPAPFGVGVEGAGVIEACGPDVEFFEPGMRVCYAGGPPGAYATHRVIDERHCVAIPEGLSDQHAAGVMVQGLTAYFLVRHIFMVDKRNTVLIHAAAGGVGMLLTQWCKHLGATVIGTVGSAEKAEQARAHGCDYPIIYTQEDFVERVAEITEGRKCHVVYDSVGQATFMRSLDCLQPFGLMVSYGQASGKVEPFDVGELQKRGSLYLTRPSFMDYTREHHDYVIACKFLFDMLTAGHLKTAIGQTYWLSDAVRAHQDLEARKTHGATILIPDGVEG